MGGYKITGAGVGSSSSDYVTIGQIQSQTVPAKQLFYAQNSVSQTVTSAATTTVTLAAVLDQNGNFAANAYTAPTTGYYEFNAGIYCTGTTITVVQLDLFKNGALDQRFSYVVPGATAVASANGTVFASATAGDVFLLKATVTGTGTVAIGGTGPFAQFGCRLISS